MASLVETETISRETRDFLHFLRRIKYDHRQFPENKDGGLPFPPFPQGIEILEAVVVEVSVVVSNIRAVSEVTMDYALELFYRESWKDSRLAYNKTLFKNKTELALHESYTNFLWFVIVFPLRKVQGSLIHLCRMPLPRRTLKGTASPTDPSSASRTLASYSTVDGLVSSANAVPLAHSSRSNPHFSYGPDPLPLRQTSL